MIYSVAKPIARGLLRVVWRARIVGEENIPAGGAAILASNHLAVADTWVMPALIRRPVHFLAKDELFDRRRFSTRVLGAFLRAVKVMPMNRAGGNASRASLDTGLAVLADGGLLGIYPEGSRSPDGRLYRGKTGVARLAVAAGCPIVPIAMLGTYEAQRGRRFFPRLSPRMTVVVGAPIDPASVADATGSERDGIRIRAVTDAIMRGIAELSGQERADEYAADAKKRLSQRAD